MFGIGKDKEKEKQAQNAKSEKKGGFFNAIKNGAKGLFKAGKAACTFVGAYTIYKGIAGDKPKEQEVIHNAEKDAPVSNKDTTELDNIFMQDGGSYEVELG